MAIANQRSIAMGALIASAMAFLLIVGLPTRGHQTETGWEYYGPCCGEKDCRSVEDQEVEQIFSGETFVDLDGNSIVVDEAGFIVRGRFIPHHRAMVSPDSKYHICTRTGPRATEWSRVYSAHDLRLAGQSPPDFRFCRDIDLTSASNSTHLGLGLNPIANDSFNNRASLRNVRGAEEPNNEAFPVFGDLLEQMAEEENQIGFERDFHCIWVPVQACQEALRDGRSKRRTHFNVDRVVREVMRTAPIEQRVYLGLVSGGRRRSSSSDQPFSPRDPDDPIVDDPPFFDPPTEDPSRIPPVFISSGTGPLLVGGLAVGAALVLVGTTPVGWIVAIASFLSVMGASYLSGWN